MKTLCALTQRNTKLFFKDKGLFFSAMIVPLILLVLYMTFLANVYRDSFVASLPAGATMDDKLIDGLVASQLFSSLLAVCCVTIAFCANVIMVQDKYTGVRKDLLVSPVKKPILALSYYLSTLAVTLIINLVALGASLLYVAAVGWYLTLGDVLLIVLDIFLFTMFGTALSSIINVFLRTQGQVSAVSTVVSACYGFICGAYMPISQFGSGLQKVLGFLPSTYSTSLIKNHAMRGVFAEMANSGFPDDVITSLQRTVDCQFDFFGHNVTVTAMVIVMVVAVALLVGIYVLLNVLQRDDRAKRQPTPKNNTKAKLA
ncbi:MAG: ABC transporter permease [Prevotella sp.]|nr:ABC transporter permease [Prevotella sp.]